MSLLPDVLEDFHHEHPLLVLQSSTAQSSLPLLKHILAQKTAKASRYIVFCLLYPPSSLLDDFNSQSVEVHNSLNRIPGYNDSGFAIQAEILASVKAAPNGPLTVAIDSINTLATDIGSFSETYRFLRELLSMLQERSSPFRLILHAVQPLDLLPLIIQTSFSPCLALVMAHPPTLLIHLAVEYLTPPPLGSPTTKFWTVFLPVSQRGSDTDLLVYGNSGEGQGDPAEVVVEILIRTAGGPGKKREVNRALEGWSTTQGPCQLRTLSSLMSVMSIKQQLNEPASNPTQNISFNLSLTTSQHESRSRVPLPYAHKGQSIEGSSRGELGAILYDPDSADDIDDDDPDEDLDI